MEITTPSETLHAQGCRAQAEGDYTAAQSCYEQALALQPDYAFSRLALGQVRMMRTSFREGRALYEARFDARAAGEADWRSLPIPRWRGEKLAGKKLYLWAEQGFGDAIMFAGFLPCFLAQSPQRVTLGMFPKMMTLMARAFPAVQVESVLEAGEYASAPALREAFPMLLKLAGNSSALAPLRTDYEKALACGTFDYAAPMGDLLVHGLPDYVPKRHPPYLTADPQRLAAMRDFVNAQGMGRRIGIAWHTQGARDAQARSIPLEAWGPILETPGCRFFSLQHHAAPEAGSPVTAPPFAPERDTEGLAALTACMDEIISIDNSVIHLAGAFGVPATLLLPKGCNFRWLDAGADTLWYRSVKAERQTAPGDWTPVIARVAEGLRRRAIP